MKAHINPILEIWDSKDDSQGFLSVPLRILLQVVPQGGMVTDMGEDTRYAVGTLY